jgi:two-component system repressor protein LuxO
VRAANGGTLFLDEICEMDIRLQVKLLRFLQTGRVQPVGASAPEAVDVRVVCATNRDPMLEVAEGRFREDLFYRLAVIPLYLPPCANGARMSN